MNTLSKYDIKFSEEVIKSNVCRLTNQLWKLIPMRENEEAWQTQITMVLIELAGLNELFSFDKKYLTLLSKLEGLLSVEVDFIIYRKTVFECISLLHEVIK